MESGVSIIVGTRDAALRPEAMRAMGFRVASDLKGGTLFLPCGTAEKTILNLGSVPLLAVTFSETTTHRTVQVKGRARRVREAREDERPWVERYLQAFAAELEVVGMPRRLSSRLNHWPAWAIELEASDLFVQTPGPRAGTRLTAND